MRVARAAAENDARFIAGPDGRPSTLIPSSTTRNERDPRRLGVGAAAIVPSYSLVVGLISANAGSALPFAEPPPEDLAPQTPFSIEIIVAGLPEPGGFGRADLRCAT